MKQIINKILLISAIALTLSSCNNSQNYVGNVAVVDNVPITKDAYAKELEYYQKFYSKKYGEDYLDQEIDRNTTKNDKLSSDLIDSMIKDQVMLNDLKSNNIKVDDSKATQIRNNLEKDLGGKDSLKANLTALGLSENDFNEILYKDSIRKIHYDYYLKNNDIKDSEVLDFYKENNLYQKQYKYQALVFDDKNEAKRVKEEIKSASDFKKFLNASIKNYDVISSDFVYKDDPRLSKAKVLEKDKVSDLFEYDGDYTILMVNSYNENENDLLIEAKDIYLKKNYIDYLNKLVRKSKIRLFV